MPVARTIAALGLLVDAYVHVVLAGDYDANTGALVSEGALFRVEAAVAVAAALLVLFVRRPVADVVVLVVTVSAAAAVLLLRYVDVGPLLGAPDMYEPIWFPEKVVTTVAEVVAAVAAAVVVGRGRAAGARVSRPST